jgi:5-methylcytosine-specific restriction protein A
LRRDPICTECRRAPSDTVDHITDHRGNLQRFFDPLNLRGVCGPCHNKKTGATHGGGGAPITPKPDLPYLVDGCVKDYGST